MSSATFYLSACYREPVDAERCVKAIIDEAARFGLNVGDKVTVALSLTPLLGDIVMTTDDDGFVIEQYVPGMQVHGVVVSIDRNR